MLRLPTQSIASLILIFSLPTLAWADNWPSWRGPNGNGSADGKGYPQAWSSTENVAWTYDIPGTGASTPAIWGDHIFVTAASETTNLVLAVNRNGDQLWQTKVGSARPGKHKKATGANSSPVTDGKHVYVYFKSGDFACLDFQGNIVWKKNLETELAEDTLWWDLGTSPVLAGELIIVACQQEGPSFVAAFNKMSGEIVWRQARQFRVPKEADQSYTTPVVNKTGEGTVIVLGADHVTAHRLSDGSESWRVGDLNPQNENFFRSISSPVIAGDLLLAPYARGQSLTAIKLNGKGDVTDTHVAWKSDKAADVPTPAVSGDRVYICRDSRSAICLDKGTGKVVWEGTLDKRKTAFSSSPSVADGKVYFTREDGTTFVVKDADHFELLATNEVGEPTVATPVLVDGRVYLRTLTKLYCFES